MKIAIVRQRYNPFGGAERFVERALQALEGQQVQLTLITRQWQHKKGLDRDVRICNPFHIGRSWRDIGFAKSVQQLIAKGEFDLVQSHERIPGCSIFRAGDGVHATWLELRSHTLNAWGRIATRLNLWHRYTLAAERTMFNDARLRAVICNSEMVKADIHARFGLANEKLHVIHNGVDLERFHPALREAFRHKQRKALGISDTTPVVLFVGSGFERKGLPQLLQAMRDLTNAHLVVVGKDKKQHAMEALANKLGIGARAHFAGGQEDVRPWYAMADVFALPTIYDPFPNVVLEALACGLPVLTSTNSGGAEIIQGNTYGAVCAALDSNAIAENLRALLALDPTNVQIAARAAVTPYAIENMGERLKSLYASLLGRVG